MCNEYMTFGIGGDKHPKGWCNCGVYLTFGPVITGTPPFKTLSYELKRCTKCKILYFEPIIIEE